MVELRIEIDGKALAFRADLPEHFRQVEGVQSTYAHLQRTVDGLLWRLAHAVGGRNS